MCNRSKSGSCSWGGFSMWEKFDTCWFDFESLNILASTQRWFSRFRTSIFRAFPAPGSLTYIWNLGSLLGMALVLQVLRGFLLTWYYIPRTSIAFESVEYLSRETENGWFLRSLHLRGASLLFALIYIHILRGMWFKSYRLTSTWLTGRILFVLIIGSAFIGYVLPWGQISLWGATVITNLVRVIPWVGGVLVIWIWGRFRVRQPLLKLMFSFHYILPLVMLLVLIIHLVRLHQTGRSRRVNLHFTFTSQRFYPTYFAKDSLNLIIIILLIMLVCLAPWRLGDPDNWIPANPIVRPVHIKPEWYFLWLYCMLRAIPNKIGGVVALVIGLARIVLLSIANSYKTARISLYHNFLVSNIVVVFLLLTWLGGCPVESPLLEMGQVLTTVWFILMFHLLIL